MRGRRQDVMPSAVLKRRQVLGTMAQCASGMAGILLSQTPPVYAAQRTLTMLTLSHFIEEADRALRHMASAFGKAHRCQVHIDFITHKETHFVVPKELQVHQGHDIVFLLYNMPP